MFRASNLLNGFMRDFNPVAGEGIKSKSRQLIEVLQLILKCQFTPKEYYRYKFYESDKDYAYMLNYLPNYYLNNNFRPALNNPEWFHIFRNKMLFNIYYRQFNIPVTNIYGLYDSNSGLTIEGNPLTNPKELKEYLLKIKPSSLVVKPVGGESGRNILIIDKIEYSGDDLFLLDNKGELIKYELFTSLLLKRNSGEYQGFLLEEKVPQHELLAQYNRSSLNTLRVITLLSKDNKVDIKLSSAKFGRDGSKVDNTGQGGLYVLIDPESGSLEHGVGGLKYQGKVMFEHPDSKLSFKGFTVPYWSEVVKLCTKAACLAPFCRSVGWDVGISPKGPVFIEGNDNHSMESQILFNGYLQPNTRKELTQLGLNYPQGVLPPLKVSMFYDAIRLWSKKKMQ